MENLQVFKNEEFGQVRTVTIDGEPWFVGKDVAVALGYEKPTDAVRKRVDEEDRGISKMETPSGAQQMTIINESGLYSLILSSKLPSAKKFKHWVTSEVLPSIRKNGGYIDGQETLSDEELLAKAVLVAQNKIAERDKIIAKQKETIEQQDKQLQIQKPFVQTAIKLQNMDNTVSFEQVAKLISDNGIDVGRNTLMKLLKQHGVLMENNSPYEKYRKAGCFTVKMTIKENHYGTKMIPVTRVTGKGLIFIDKKLREWFGLENFSDDIDLDEIFSSENKYAWLDMM